MFRTLLDHGVRFVVIGGMAGSLLGSPMATFDLDVCYARDKDNLERLASALRALGARLRGGDEDVPFLLDAKTLSMGDSFTFMTNAGALDVLATPSGSRGFGDLAARAVRVDMGGYAVDVVAIDDLIRMKRAAARVKDLVAVENLLALRDDLAES